MDIGYNEDNEDNEDICDIDDTEDTITGAGQAISTTEHST
jgi:hypothetical protein